VNKQIRSCAFDVKIDNGTTNASIQGYPKAVEVFSGSYEWRPYYYGGSATDEALSGRLRSRLGGYRIEGQLTWERQANSSNYLNTLNDMTIGTQKLFATNAIADSYVAKINVATVSALGPNDALNGMRVEFDSGDVRNVVDYHNSNKMIVLDAVISLSGTEVVNVYALSNMTPRVFFNPDSSQSAPARTEQVVVTESAFTASLQSTVVNQPTSISFRGTNVETTIPAYYKL
jgi:hypothetical protein